MTEEAELRFDIREVAERIGVPPEEWPGKCHEIAILFLSHGLVTGEARYGHYTGPISQECEIEAWRGQSFSRHGWVELDDGRILDPTRWVFEAVEPYVYVGRNMGEYDAGGNRLRMAMLGPPPPYSGMAPRSTIQIWSESVEAHRFVMDKLLGGSVGLTQEQAIWLAHVDPNILGKHAKPIYTAFQKAKATAWIPVDNFDMVMGKAARGERGKDQTRKKVTKKARKR